MQRRKFIQSSLAAGAGATLTTEAISTHEVQAAQKEIYELREYEIRFGADVSQLEKYFQNALIPALNKHGVKTVGVFKEWRPTDPAKVFLFIPYASIDLYLSINAKVKADADFIRNSAPYNAVPVDKAIYRRFTSSLIAAFDGFPKLVVPTGASRVFELRTYEGYSEDAVTRKVRMFNDGEFPIFERAKLNTVFGGEVIAGDVMPRLTYMITCGSMEERDKGWGAFIADPAWKKLVSDPQYANTISKISNVFLVPTAYSQV